jgi:hypothetical protein
LKWLEGTAVVTEYFRFGALPCCWVGMSCPHDSGQRETLAGCYRLQLIAGLKKRQGSPRLAELDSPSITMQLFQERGKVTNLSSVVSQLRNERTQVQGQLDRLDQAISLLRNLSNGSGSISVVGRTISASARRRIAGGRWESKTP